VGSNPDRANDPIHFSAEKPDTQTYFRRQLAESGTAAHECATTISSRSPLAPFTIGNCRQNADPRQ
jgi:hypothetical protein